MAMTSVHDNNNNWFIEIVSYKGSVNAGFGSFFHFFSSPLNFSHLIYTKHTRFSTIL